MKGIVFEGNGKMTVETVPDPTILEPGDAIVRVTKAGICGSDLHILNHGEAFGFDHGCRIGHEFVGVEVFLGAPDIPWDQAFMKNTTICGGVAPVKHYLPELWPLLESGRIDPSPVLTHDLPLSEGTEGYAVMASRQEGSVKVALSPGS